MLNFQVHKRLVQPSKDAFLQWLIVHLAIERRNVVAFILIQSSFNRSKMLLVLDHIEHVIDIWDFEPDYVQDIDDQVLVDLIVTTILSASIYHCVETFFFSFFAKHHSF